MIPGHKSAAILLSPAWLAAEVYVRLERTSRIFWASSGSKLDKSERT